MKKIRILNYAVNGLGLGHITRLIAINRWIRRITGALGIKAEIFFLTSSECDTIAYQNDFSAFKIPSKNSIRDAGIKTYTYRRIAKQWIWNSINLINPDIFIVDTFPYGSFNELYDIMDFGFKKVFIYRAIKPIISESENFQKAISAYDKIIIPVENEINDYSIPEAISERVFKTEEIILRDKEELYTREEAREMLGVNEDATLCYVTLGGGGDENAEILFSKITDILKNITDVEFIIGAGPLYKGREFRAKNISWLYRYNSIEYYNAFDFALSSGGYNSVHELLYTNIPSIFYPLSRFYDDQERRIENLYCQNLCIKLNTLEENEIIEKINYFKDKENRNKIKCNIINKYNKNSAIEVAKEILSDIIPTEDIEHIEEYINGSYFLELKKNNIRESIGLDAIRILDMNYNEYKKIQNSLNIISEQINLDDEIKKAIEEINEKMYIDFIEYPLHTLASGYLKYIKNKEIEYSLGLKYLKVFLKINYKPNKSIQDVLLEATNYIDLLTNKKQNINDSLNQYIFENSIKIKEVNDEV